MTHEREKSDRGVVPVKPPNNAGKPAAEAGEGRPLAKGNSPQQNVLRTQRRDSMESALERVRQAARQDDTLRFTALLHHIYDIGCLESAYLALSRDASAGVDGVTWRAYRENLESNLHDLSTRLQQGTYRASPVQRVYVPKPDGRQRPIGVPTLEDKIVQRATVEVLNAIFETDFLGFSYGFRPGRNPHDALDALAVGLFERRVNYVLDADLLSFFDTMKHEWIIKFVEHRIKDQRVISLIQKWLAAGVLEDGHRTQSQIGAVQGGSISPLLSNLYLHYVFDLWTQRWRNQAGRGEVIVVRYADDFVVGFEHRRDAETFLDELRERLEKFGLETHPEKTRILEFGRYAAKNRERRGEGKPETFNFLGFTHICGKSRRGSFLVKRQTVRKRYQAKLQEVKIELRRRLTEPIPKQGAYLKSVMMGHNRYYGVPGNGASIGAFRSELMREWRRMLRRRSQKQASMEKLRAQTKRWVPYAKISHPWPNVRFVVRTQGKSRMR